MACMYRLKVSVVGVMAMGFWGSGFLLFKNEWQPSAKKNMDLFIQRILLIENRVFDVPYYNTVYLSLL